MAQSTIFPNEFLSGNASVPFWRKSLIILVGPSGSGKSTFAGKHFPPTMTVSTDYCRSLICDSPANQSISDDAFEIFYFIIEKRLKNGYPAVADSTALRKHYRQKLLELASKYGFFTVLILFDMPKGFCAENDKNRHFSVGQEVQNNQFNLLEKTKLEVAEEKYEKIVVFHTKEELDNFSYRWSLPSVECTFPGPYDIIGDVHGSCRELKMLLDKLGYRFENGTFSHSSGRKAVFLGDILDRGTENLQTFDIVYGMWQSQNAFYVPGNHCNKMVRYLNGSQVNITDGMENTIKELESLTEERRKTFEEKFIEMYSKSPPYWVMDNGRLVVVHAGILQKYIGRDDKKVWSCCLYGPGTISGSEEKQNEKWKDDYHGTTTIVHGHIPVAEAKWHNNIIDIDLGSGQNGSLCALRYPEKEIVMVPCIGKEEI